MFKIISCALSIILLSSVHIHASQVAAAKAGAEQAQAAAVASAQPQVPNYGVLASSSSSSSSSSSAQPAKQDKEKRSTDLVSQAADTKKQKCSDLSLSLLKRFPVEAQHKTIAYIFPQILNENPNLKKLLTNHEWPAQLVKRFCKGNGYYFLSPNNKMCAIIKKQNNEGVLEIWDLENNTIILTVNSVLYEYHALRWSLDSAYFAVAICNPEGNLSVWNVANKNESCKVLHEGYDFCWDNEHQIYTTDFKKLFIHDANGSLIKTINISPTYILHAYYPYIYCYIKDKLYVINHSSGEHTFIPLKNGLIGPQLTTDKKYLAIYDTCYGYIYTLAGQMIRKFQSKNANLPTSWGPLAWHQNSYCIANFYKDRIWIYDFHSDCTFYTTKLNLSNIFLNYIYWIGTTIIFNNEDELLYYDIQPLMNILDNPQLSVKQLLTVIKKCNKTPLSKEDLEVLQTLSTIWKQVLKIPVLTHATANATASTAKSLHDATVNTTSSSSSSSAARASATVAAMTAASAPSSASTSTSSTASSSSSSNSSKH